MRARGRGLECDGWERPEGRYEFAMRSFWAEDGGRGL